MKREDYIHASIRVRTLEKQLIEPLVLKRMVECSNFDEAYRLLNDTSYSNVLSKLSKPTDYETALKEIRNQLYVDLEEICKGSLIVDFLELPYQYHNIKVLMRSYFSKTDLKMLIIPLQKMDLVYLMGIFEYPEKNPNKTPVETVIKRISDLSKTVIDIRWFDTLLDQMLIKQQQMIAETLQLDCLKTYLENRVDWINLSTAFRFIKQPFWNRDIGEYFLSGGHISNEILCSCKQLDVDHFLSQVLTTKPSDYMSTTLKKSVQSSNENLLETARDNEALRLFHHAGKITYGPEVILSYVLQKEMEIQNIRTILVAKKSKLDLEQLLERLRDLDG